MPELSPISVAFLVFPNVTQLDLTGPAQVLSRLGNVTLDLVWKSRDPVATDSGFSLLPTKTFDEVEHDALFHRGRPEEGKLFVRGPVGRRFVALQEAGRAEH